MNVPRSVATLSTTLLVAFAFACGDEGPVEPDPGTPEPSAIEAVGGDAQSGTAGAALPEPLVVEVTDQDGDPMSDVSVAWAVTAGDGGLASASTSTDADGRASVAWTLGTTAGENEVSATVEDLPAVTFTATGEPGAPATLALSPDSVDVYAIGDTVRLAADASDAHGNAVPDIAFAWTSADTSVATVDTTGLIRAEAAGQTQIVASTTEGSGADTATVVVDPQAATLTVSPGSVALTAAGDTVRLAVVAEDANGHPIAAVSASWSSSDEATATVSSEGLVTAQADGTAEITAMVDTASFSVDVPVTTGSGVARAWMGGDDGGADAWANPLNWAPAGAPNGQDTLTVAADADAMPVLGADAAAGRIEVESGASLDIGAHTLTASGSVEALGSVTGTGTLVLTGAGATLQGTVPALRVEAATTLAGETTVGGIAYVAGGTLHFAGFAVRIQP